MAVRDVIIKESEVGSIPDNTETSDLLNEGSQQLGIWHPNDGRQDGGNKKKQGTFTTIKEEWHEAESVNTQEKTLRRDASDVEEAALYEESTATRRSLRDGSPWKTVKQSTSHSQGQLASLKRHWSKRTRLHENKELHETPDGNSGSKITRKQFALLTLQ